MKLGFTMAAVALCAAGLAAQDAAQKTRTKISVEDGKTITVTGCVQRGDAGGFTLTNVAGKDGALGSYILADDGDDGLDGQDLDGHVGHRVEITGTAADKGSGKIKVETKNEGRDADGDKRKVESTSEVKGDLKGLPYLGVKSLRMIAAVCP